MNPIRNRGRRRLSICQLADFLVLKLSLSAVGVMLMVTAATATPSCVDPVAAETQLAAALNGFWRTSLVLCISAGEQRGSHYQPVQELVVIDRRQLATPQVSMTTERRSLLAYVMAHEWGHHVQRRLSSLGQWPVFAREQQADCLAGYFLGRTGIGKGDSFFSVFMAAGNVGDRTLYLLPHPPASHGDNHLRMSAVSRGLAAVGARPIGWIGPPNTQKSPDVGCDMKYFVPPANAGNGLSQLIGPRTYCYNSWCD